MLGGSFNPAHPGHVHVSREALRRLKLDEVWWLVSPQNPLKSRDDMADFDERVEAARVITRSEPHVHVSTLERELGTRYTADTLSTMKRLYPRTQFVWLMGADNLAGFHRWQHWRHIFDLVPVAVFDRAPFSHHALRSHAAVTAAHARLSMEEAALLLKRPLPVWAYIHMSRDPHSSTEIRAARKKQPKR